jgi:hypothetical protein
MASMAPRRAVVENIMLRRSAAGMMIAASEVVFESFLAVLSQVRAVV